MPTEDTFEEYLADILDAIIQNRIEAKTLRDMTPEQRDAWRENLKRRERTAIDEGKSRHEPTE